MFLSWAKADCGIFLALSKCREKEEKVDVLIELQFLRLLNGICRDVHFRISNPAKLLPNLNRFRF